MADDESMHSSAPSSDAEDADLVNADSSVGEEPKDDAELELERLVFGDSAQFRDDLQKYQQTDLERVLDAQDSEDGEDLAQIEDADLFFLDAGPDETTKAAPSQQLSKSKGSALLENDESALTQRVWYDSDEDRMTVSLLSVPRLRKLRTYEGEDVISGREYTKRLRRQYEMLNPMPKWATSALQKRQKHARGSIEEDSEDIFDVDHDDDGMIEDGDLSAQPLAKLLQSNASITRTRAAHANGFARLRPDTISIERMKDLVPTQPSAVTCLSMHAHLPFLLSSGPSSTVYMHHINPHPPPPEPPNALITSLHLKHTPLSTAVWSPFPDPSNPFSPHPTTTTTPDHPHPKIYLSSRRRYFHTWTLPTGQIAKTTRIYGEQRGQSNTQASMETLKPSPCGHYLALLGTTRKGGGVVNILSASTTQWIAQARVEGRNGVADFAWWADGRGLCIVSRAGEVSEWSVERRRVLCRWQDQGAVGTTVLALSGTGPSPSSASHLGPDRWVAVGSSAGIVNVYDRQAWFAAAENMPPPNPEPTAILTPLTTPISHLHFSPCGQLLVLASRWKRDALRLAHLPLGASESGNSGDGARKSITLYRNWPTAQTPLGRISAVAIGSVRGGMHAGDDDDEVANLVLFVGNEAGVVRGWEITG